METSLGVEHSRRIAGETAPGSVAELLCSYDLRGNFIEVNAAFEAVLGLSREMLLGRRLETVLEPESVETVRLDTLQHVGGGTVQPIPVRMRTKSGRVITVELLTRLLFERGKPVAIQAFGKNLADLETEKLLSMEQRLSSTESRLAKFTRHLKQLHRLSTATYDSLEEVFADYLKTGCQVFGLPNGIVLQAEADAGEGTVRAVHGESPRLRAKTRFRLEETHFTTVAQRLRTLTLTRAEGAVEPDFAVCIATPILVDSELFGTLSFFSPKGRTKKAFGREDKEIIELMASSIARFILQDRVQTERKMAEALETRRNRVLEMVAENRSLSDTLAQLACLVEDQLPGAICAVMRFLQDGVVLEAGPSLPPGFGEALRHHGLCSAESSACFDFVVGFGLRSVPAKLIVSGAGAILGAIAVFFRIGEGLDNQHPDVLNMAARLAAIAIEQRQLTDKLAHQARHDFLTGLPNRLHFLELLEKCLRSRGPMVAVLFIDLDRFKQINDTLGHSVGDRLLIEVGERLRSGLNGSDDIAARIGGDEFAVILSAPEHEDVVLIRSRQFLDLLRAPYLIDGRELFVTSSIGISLFPTHGDSASTLLRRADVAMYQAKREGKNGMRVFVPDTQKGAIEQLDLENALRRALEKSEFELFYQPILSAQEELDGFEVLLAWNHATRGKISAAQFIPMAEETGLIVPIGAWVLGAACEKAAEWLRQGLPVKRIAVNVSALQFARPNFVDSVAGVLARTGLPPRLLGLELTESLVLRDIGESIHRMAQLHELGVTLAIDDFGTGYSSLNYLRRLPADELKIDQSFLRDLQSPSATLTVVQGIVSMAHQMKMAVVAEGVERREEFELMRSAGCDRVQGHLFGAALRADDVTLLLTKARGPMSAVS